MGQYALSLSLSREARGVQKTSEYATANDDDNTHHERLHEMRPRNTCAGAQFSLSQDVMDGTYILHVLGEPFLCEEDERLNCTRC